MEDHVSASSAKRPVNRQAGQVAARLARRLGEPFQVPPPRLESAIVESLFAQGIASGRKKRIDQLHRAGGGARCSAHHGFKGRIPFVVGAFCSASRRAYSGVHGAGSSVSHMATTVAHSWRFFSMRWGIDGLGCRCSSGGRLLSAVGPCALSNSCSGNSQNTCFSWQVRATYQINKSSTSGVHQPLNSPSFRIAAGQRIPAAPQWRAAGPCGARPAERQFRATRGSPRSAD